MLIDRNDLLKHLLGIPDLDLSADLYAEPLAGPRFRLGACSSGPGRDRQGVENVVYRKPLTNYAEVLEREPNALRLTIFGVIVRLRLRPEAFRMEIASA